MFDVARFIDDCRAAVVAENAPASVEAILARAVEDPASVMEVLGQPARAGAAVLYCDETLTIANLVWGPEQVFRPHDHRVWAAIGIYTGREDNIFWKRSRDGKEPIRAVAARAIFAGECAILGKDIIHSLVNPIPRLTGAIHVYGGNLLTIQRSEWDPDTLAEHDFDTQRAQADFERMNAGLPTPEAARAL